MSDTVTVEVASSRAPTEIDVAMDSFIAETQKEFSEAQIIDEVAVQNPGTESATASDPAVSASPAPVTEAPKTQEDPAERGLERLVAREVELRAREDRVKGAETEIEALRTRLRELETRVLPSELADKIKSRPHDGLRELGLDPDEVIRTALMDKIGDKATPEMKAMLAQTQMNRKMAELEAQVRSFEQKQAATAFFNQVQAGAGEFVRKSEGLSKYPSVAQVAKGNPDRVHQEIMDEITRDAAERAPREPNGNVMSYEDAAARVEARWAAMRSLLVPQTPPSQPAASTPTSQVKTEAETSGKKSVTPKPPDRPIAPWLQRDVGEEEAIRVAVQEWQRSLKGQNT